MEKWGSHQAIPYALNNELSGSEPELHCKRMPYKFIGVPSDNESELDQETSGLLKKLQPSGVHTSHEVLKKPQSSHVNTFKKLQAHFSPPSKRPHAQFSSVHTSPEVLKKLQSTGVLISEKLQPSRAYISEVLKEPQSSGVHKSRALKRLQSPHAHAFGVLKKPRQLEFHSSNSLPLFSFTMRNFKRDMSCPQLCEWLSQSGASHQAVSAVRAQEVDGDTFLQLPQDHQDLNKLLQCNLTLGASNKLRKLLKKVKDNENIVDLGNGVTLFNNCLLGKGAFGVVYKGDYRGQECAIKILHTLDLEINVGIAAGGCEQKETVAAFKRECKFLKSLKHPNIVKHLATTAKKDTNSDRSRMVLVLELMDSSLRSFLSNKSNALGKYEEISVCQDIASALEYIHSQDIVHRDLCADNVLLKMSDSRASLFHAPVAKISDFGMSRIIDKNTLSHTLTAMGHRMGYLPPEAPLIEATRYGPSLDIFSFGAIVLQIVCGVSYIKTVEERLLLAVQVPQRHILKKIIVGCLRDDKDMRPLAAVLCAQLERMTLFTPW